MSQLPAVSPKVQEQIYKDLLKGSMRKFGGALDALAGFILTDLPAKKRKSAEELALDHYAGEEAAEARRRLALSAIERVPPERRIFPAPQIAGPILRDIEFEPEGTPIWQMWSELLSRACDSDRVSEAHPAFPGIIAQLAPDEARLLSALAGFEPHAMDAPLPMLKSSTMGIQFPSKLQFYLNHLSSLGLMIIPYGWAPMTHAIMIDEVLTFMLSPLGLSFVAAVTSRTTG